MVSGDVWESAQAAEREYWVSDEWRGLSYEQRLSEWQRHLSELGLAWGEFEKKRVLDVGCGPVGIGYFLKARRRVGIDPLADVYAPTNGQWGEPIELVEGVGESIPFPDQSFDAVFCINALDHTRSPSEVVRELRRVLAIGGLLVFHTDLDSPIRHARKYVVRGDAHLHPHHLSMRWLESQLDGFEITKIHRDLQVFRGQRFHDAAFWDGMLYRLTRLPAFMNHVWLSALRSA